MYFLDTATSRKHQYTLLTGPAGHLTLPHDPLHTNWQPNQNTHDWTIDTNRDYLEGPTGTIVLPTHLATHCRTRTDCHLTLLTDHLSTANGPAIIHGQANIHCPHNSVIANLYLHGQWYIHPHTTIDKILQA